jgi:hypothetical protein
VPQIVASDPRHTDTPGGVVHCLLRFMHAQYFFRLGFGGAFVPHPAQKCEGIGDQRNVPYRPILRPRLVIAANGEWAGAFGSQFVTGRISSSVCLNATLLI